MKNIIYSLLIFSLLSILTIGCNQKPASKNKADVKSTDYQAPPKKAPEATGDYQSPLPKVAQLIAPCNKIEYMFYDYGISFESPSQNETRRFFSYIIDKPADTGNCKKGKYDGGIVFKDPEGDIKMEMEFNILKNCNRVVFNVDGKEYAHPLNEQGVGFFQKVLDMRNNMQNGGGQ